MPDPEPVMIEKTFLVVGPNAVHGNPSGAEFTKALHPEQERQLIEGGHIKVVGATTPAKNATREEWDAFATELGINPADFASKDELMVEVDRVTRGGNASG